MGNLSVCDSIFRALVKTNLSAGSKTRFVAIFAGGGNEGQPVRSRDGPQAARTVIRITARTAQARQARGSSEAPHQTA